MKQLSNYIKIIPLDYFESFDGSVISGSVEPDLILSKNDLILKETPKKNDAGIYYDQKLTVITLKLSDTIRKLYQNRRTVVVLLYDDNGAPYIWGSDLYRLRITITPNIDEDSLELESTSTSPLF